MCLHENLLLLSFNSNIHKPIVLQRGQQYFLDISLLRISLKDEIHCHCLQKNTVQTIFTSKLFLFHSTPRARGEHTATD